MGLTILAISDCSNTGFLAINLPSPEQLLCVLAVVQADEIDSQMNASESPQRAVFLQAQPAVVSLISSVILTVLGLQFTDLKI